MFSSTVTRLSPSTPGQCAPRSTRSTKAEAQSLAPTASRPRAIRRPLHEGNGRLRQVLPMLFAASGTGPCEFPKTRMKVDISELALPGWLRTTLRPHEECRFHSTQHALQRLRRARVAGALPKREEFLAPSQPAVPGQLHAEVHPYQVALQSPRPPSLPAMARIAALSAASTLLLRIAAALIAAISLGSRRRPSDGQCKNVGCSTTEFFASTGPNSIRSG